ncbi:MAG: MBL fold metallo-hydrolase [Methanothrix sp.]|nr:MBL fold metallo-hydrolase [Methanothrix sp.]
MIATWLGHSCFLLKGDDDLLILLDPFFEDEVGYPIPIMETNIVTISHDHLDHNNIDAAGSNSDVIFGPGEYISMGIEILGIKSYHDDKKGRQRGENTIFCFELDGVRVCHLGDLGHALSPSQIREIGPVDLLFIPVGGRYTIDAKGANEVMKQLHPAVTVPMHYRTAALSFDLDTVDDFIKEKEGVTILETLQLTEETLEGDGRVVLLSCPAAEGGPANR